MAPIRFRPKTESSWRLQISAPQSAAEVGVKLARVVSRHEQVKAAYRQLKSQIKIDLVEAEQVFASLAIPLMRLVGLKSEEMAQEGRFTTIIMDSEFSQGCHSSSGVCDQSPVLSPMAGEVEDKSSRIHGQLEEKSCTSKAIIGGKLFLEKQQTQLRDLVYLLKQIGNRVNSHQDDILHNLVRHRVSLHKLFKKAICGLSTLHNQKRDASLITLNLLRAIFEYMDAVLCSVEGGVEDLMYDLADHMCNPMVDYVNGITADMKSGTSAKFLAAVGEMETALRKGRIELEEARKRVRVAEKEKIEAQCKMKAMEERVKRTKKCHSFFSYEAQQRHTEPFVTPMPLGMGKEEANCDKAVRDLEGMVKKSRRSEVPMGPEEIMYFEPNSENQKCTRGRSKMCQRSQLRGPDLETPRLDAQIAHSLRLFLFNYGNAAKLFHSAASVPKSYK